MLELISVSQIVSRPREEALSVLEHVSFSCPPGHLMAVLGAPGSGKSTLLQVLAGIRRPTGGAVLFQGRDCGEAPLPPNQVGHVPAEDDVLNEVLSVRESLMSALLLRVAGQNREQRIDRASHLLVLTGLETVASQRVSTLSLAQRRRLKLALALVSHPAVLLCDEFTDGLDVKSERELAALLRLVAGDHPARVVLHATESVGNLAAFDSVVVLHEGHVCFHGPARAITHYFSITTLEELHARLAKRPAARWGESWTRHRDSYYNAFKLGGSGESLAAASEADEAADGERILLPAHEQAAAPAKAEPAPEAPALPALAAQARHLILRRWTTLRRTRREWRGQAGQLLLSLGVTALLMGPNAGYLQKLAAGSTAPEVLWPAAYTCSMVWLVQILWSLAFGVRNGAREIAAERPLWERERAGGLRPGAYLLGKLGFLAPLALAQSLLLGLGMELLSAGLPGPAPVRLLLLVLNTLAFTLIALGISARCRSAERAHSRAWMLVFANLLLAGALLGFPRMLGGVVQPLVTAYYGWSGGMDTLQGTPVFAPLTALVRTWFATPLLAALALAAHACAGVLLAWSGLRRRG